MSFTTDIKKEVANNELKDCCVIAQLSALIQLCSTLQITSNGMMILIKTENASVAKRMITIVKHEFECEVELAVIKKMNLKKNNIYQIRIINKCKEILDTLEILTSKGLQEHPSYQLTKKDCCARSYLAGAFMAVGSVNAPNKSNYHLEIKTNVLSHATYIQKLMLRFDLSAKIIKRRNNEVVYLKAADKIADFLRCVGSFEGLMSFEDIRITRDFRNSMTRLDNCELANEVKSVATANRHITDIQLIKDSLMFDSLDDKIKEIAYLRLDYPEASLNELAVEHERINGSEISKSGMKHRLKKISDIASNIRLKNEQISEIK